MRTLIILILLIPVTTKCQFRNNFLGTYTGQVDMYEVGHFKGSDRVYVDTSATDTSYIKVADSLNWVNLEYILYPDSTFANFWEPTLQYGYFYSNGDSIFLHEVHNNPYYREWHCGRLGAGINEPSRSLFNISPNPAKEKIFISPIHSFEKLELSLFNCIGEIVFEKNIQSLVSKTAIDLPQLCDGIYFLKISALNSSFSQKLVIRN
jgi:hypothetical protein